MRKNIIYQYRKIDIILEFIGKFSGSKRTKHIKTIDFFIIDIIKQCDVEVTSFTTKSVLYDILTKPKQGKALCENKSVLIIFPVEYEES